MREQHDIPVLLTGCLAAGGAGMFLIMSVLIGFGVSTLIGREAMYLCLLLELVNLLVLHARAGALLRSGKAPQPSPKMRLLRRVSGIGWLTGAVLLVGSLVLLLFGLPLANIWVKLAAYIRRAGHDAQLGRLPDRIPPPAHVRCGLCAGERKGAAAMIRDLFLDLDDTLLDFGEAERHGIIRTLRELGIAPTEETSRSTAASISSSGSALSAVKFHASRCSLSVFPCCFRPLAAPTTRDPENHSPLSRHRPLVRARRRGPAQLARPALPSLSGLERRGGHAVQPSGERRDLPLFSGNFHFGGHGLSQAGKGLF